VIITQKPGKMLLYNYKKWYDYKKSCHILKSTKDTQFMAETELQIMTM
jgi:hypothetical protein